MFGDARATSGVNYGVFGQANSTNGTGVYGIAKATTGTTYGVYGKSASIDGVGVYGIASATTGSTYGVYGEAASPNGIGLYGLASGTTGVNYGVYGQSASNGGTGVYGYVNTTAGTGVYGLADLAGSSTSVGVYGRGDGDDGFGVAGAAFGAGTGLGAWSNSGFLIEARSGNYPDGQLELYVTQNGSVYSNGEYYSYKRSKLDGTTRALSSIQSPEVWLEDFGRGNLMGGIAVISIDPLFASLANLSTEYYVFLTPQGDSLGLYVAKMTATSFEVHEQNGGKSNIAFSYRIVAKQAGSEAVRLPEVTIPEPSDVNQQPDEGIEPSNSPQPATPKQPTQDQQP